VLDHGGEDGVSEINEVKAGKYQLVALSWDHITSKPTEPLDFTRYHRGDVVDLNVEDAKRLVAAGAVVKPGQLEKTAVEQAKAIAEQAQRAYEAALAGLPEEVRAEIAPGTVPATGELDITASGDKVLEWVGDDRARAAQALAAEQATDKPRSTLVPKLEALANPGA
jgi:hypothetical protein